LTEIKENMAQQKNIFVVIPIFNESKVIQSVIDEVLAAGPYKIVIVDDGSSDDTYAVAKNNICLTALRHKINRGKGAAVKTGIAAANLLGADIVVTMDGDGQHDPTDIAPLVAPIITGECDVVLGTRRTDTGEMPWVKVIANIIGNLVTWLFCGILVSDSQSGFRAYSHFAARIIDTKADKYEYDSKVIREISNNRLKFKEVPIKVRYTDYSMGKTHKQGFVNGIKTLIRIIWGVLV